MLIFKTLPGIGDISWIYSKCRDIAQVRPVAFQICADGPPRSEPFVALLPHITNLGYGPFTASNGFGELLPPETDLATLPDGTYTVSVNPYLEYGMCLADIFPNQKTHYHYPLNIPPTCAAVAQYLISRGSDGPRIGFYASSYAHSPERGFWNYDEWGGFLQEIARLYPTATFIALGTAYDDKTLDVCRTLVRNGVRLVKAIGVDIGTTIEIIRRLDYFFAFPSGLGILADVVDTPAMMWYFSNFADAFIDTYPDPVAVASRRHINLLFQKPPEALAYFQKHGAPWIKTGISRKDLLRGTFLRGKAGGKVPPKSPAPVSSYTPKPTRPQGA